MKKFTALILAAGLLLDMLCIGASAEEYGRNPHYNTITAQGDYIYYYGDNAVWAKNLVNGKKRIVCKTGSSEEYVDYICAAGNCLYYVNHFSSRYYGDTVIYKVDIGSGNKTEFYNYRDKWIDGIFVQKNKIYIQFDEITHDEVPTEYYVDILDTEGNFLKYLTPCRYNNSKFIDTDSYEACIAAQDVKITYDGESYDMDFTDAYNIVKIRSDLSEERITIPEKVGKSIEKFVYCGEKYVYYIDNNKRLCRYNAEAKKYAVLVRDGVIGAKYKDGAIYFLTEKGDLKKYKKGRVSTVKESPDCDFDAYFFDDYIVYEYKDRHGVIGYDGKELADS